MRGKRFLVEEHKTHSTSPLRNLSAAAALFTAPPVNHINTACREMSEK
jgi:hypothetical protein